MKLKGITNEGLKRVAGVIKGQDEDEAEWYRVGIGGSPKDTWAEYDSFESAIDAAFDLAYQMAEDKGIETASIDFYDFSNRGGSMGVCPDGDEGGYWPSIEKVE